MSPSEKIESTDVVCLRCEQVDSEASNQQSEDIKSELNSTLASLLNAHFTYNLWVKFAAISEDSVSVRHSALVLISSKLFSAEFFHECLYY